MTGTDTSPGERPPEPPQDLAGQIADLRRRFEDDLQARRSETAALIGRVEQVAGLTSALAQTRTDVATISDDLDTIVDRLTTIEAALKHKQASPRPGTPIVWHRLTPEQSAGLWPQFTAWVVWLADTYALAVHQLPRCWHDHGGLVQELTDLWTSFLSAHDRDKGDTGGAVHQWHDALGRALDRFASKWLGQCVNGTHQPRAHTTWADDAEYRAAFAEPPPGPRPATEPPGENAS